MKVARAGQERLRLDGARFEECEIVAAAEIRVRLHRCIRIAPNDKVVTAAVNGTVRGIAVDRVLVAGFDWNPLGRRVLVDEAEYERLGVDLVVGNRAVPSDGVVGAEDVSAGRSNDCQRLRLVVAPGMKAGRVEAVSTRTIGELEPSAPQLAQLDELVLHREAADCQRVKKALVQSTTHSLDNSIATWTRTWPEADPHLSAHEHLLELVLERLDLVEHGVALGANAPPLGLVAVNSLECDAHVVPLQLALVLRQSVLNRLHDVCTFSIACRQLVQALELVFAHLVRELLVVSDQLLHVVLPLLRDLGLYSLEVVDHELVRLERGQLVEKVCEFGEALGGRLVLLAVLHAQQQRNVLIEWEAASYFRRTRTVVNLVTEVALDLAICVCAALVLFHQHLVDVSGTRAIAARKDARIIVNLTAADEFAHHQRFQTHPVDNN